MEDIKLTTITKEKDVHRYIVAPDGHKESILLNVEEYYKLLEEIDDLRTLKERKNERVMSNQQMKEKLQHSGHLPSQLP